MYESDLKKNRNLEKNNYSEKKKRKSSLDNFNDSKLKEKESSENIKRNKNSFYLKD
jgi:hypothetical protein